jgi:hypothetical protein
MPGKAMKRPCNPIAALSASLLLLACGAAFAEETAASHEPGTWQKHEYSFAYMGFTTTYSCDGLADKLKRLLLAAGARKDVKSRPGACGSGFGRPDKFARADLVFYTLAPADASTAPGDKPVNGAWRPVSLSVRSPSELALGDCELVDQFRSTVVPMFVTRNLDNRTTCVPNQLSGSTINLKFDSFVATAPP